MQKKVYIVQKMVKMIAVCSGNAYQQNKNSDDLSIHLEHFPE